MTTPQWDRITALFDGALALPADRREAYLATAADSPEIRAKIEALLAAYDEPDRPTTGAVDLLATAKLDSFDAEIQAGARLGPYQIVREIGRGGMGSVFEAYRSDGDFAKRVAIKTIAMGRISPELEGRFRRERRILAKLDHRNIAALLDGGVTETGLPWFAMEYVEGIPIDRYGEQHGLDVKARVGLLRQVCGAVQFAHGRLVVHRDLKPSNILVSDDGTVKLLDFGVARLMEEEDPSTADGLDLTERVPAPLTTAYASPEQLSGGPVSTASDIHALGLVAFLLLGRRHPFREPAMGEGELRRRLIESQAPSLDVDSELDLVVAMALRKEPDRRYSSAASFGEDLRRWAAGLPVSAHPDSLAYRVRSFVRRHRAVVAGATVGFVALAVGLVVALRQTGIAQTERDRARLEAAKATRVAAFVQEMLQSADPRESGPDLSVAAALAGAARRADSALAAEPEVLAAVESVIGSSYLGLGRPNDAEPLFRRALEIRRGLGAGHEASVAASLRQLGQVHADRGELVPAESLLRQALEYHRRAPAGDSGASAVVVNELGDLLQYKGDLDGAEAMHRQAISLETKLYGERSVQVAASLNNLGVIEGQRNHWAAAESLSRVAVAIVTERLGNHHPDVAAGQNALAFVLETRGKPVEAESLYRSALAIRLEKLGPAHHETARSHTNLGWLLYETGRPALALAEAEAVLALRGKSIPEEHPALGSSLVLAGQCLIRLGRLDDAERTLEDALAVRKAGLPPDHWLIAATESALGEALALRGKRARAEPLLRAAYQKLLATRGADAEQTKQAKERIDRLFRS